MRTAAFVLAGAALLCTGVCAAPARSGGGVTKAQLLHDLQDLNAHPGDRAVRDRAMGDAKSADAGPSADPSTEADIRSLRDQIKSRVSVIETHGAGLLGGGRQGAGDMAPAGPAVDSQAADGQAADGQAADDAADDDDDGGPGDSGAQGTGSGGGGRPHRLIPHQRPN